MVPVFLPLDCRYATDGRRPKSELVLSNSFKVLCFVRPTQGNLRELRYRSGCTEQPVDVVSVVFQTTGVGFSTVAVTDVSSGVLSISTFGAGNCSTDTEAFVIISDRTANAVAVLTQSIATIVESCLRRLRYRFCPGTEQQSSGRQPDRRSPVLR